MKRWSHVALALCLAAGTAACAGEGPEADRPADTAPVGTVGRDVNPAADPGAAASREFVADMLADGSAEVELGRLAQQKTKNAQVRQFAEMMVEDHTKAGDELKKAAAAANISALPSEGAAEDAAALKERLGKLSGAEFDREYIDAMVEDHEEAVDEAQDRAENAAEPEVKQWASGTLPTLKRHLERAKQIQESLEKSR